MTSHAETHDLIERAAHLARLGWAVEKHAARGEVEFRLTDLRDTAHALEWPDLAHACDKGGDELDGPVLLTDEPGGDAMRWQPVATNPPGWPKPRPTHCPCPACTATKETR